MRFSAIWPVLSVFGLSCAGAHAVADGPLRVREGFRVDLVYPVAREEEGSWISLACDPRGRLIASDQTGGLYRIDPQQVAAQAEQLEVPIGHAHGLVFAFDSLYAVVAERKYQGPGLYRVRDTDGDDVFDHVQLLQSFDGTGEHGPHSVVPSPDGQSLFVIAGNKTKVPDTLRDNNLVPPHWGEDDLLPRLWGPIGSEVGTPAPGGWIARTDPAGREWQLFAVGLRNGFDLAFNPDGELFTVDADAEFDLGTPWYQPTRVFHVVAGTDFGWRSGAGKWPPYYADTLPPVSELGPGSPTGISFGHGTSFPVRYQHALFVGDWSRGRILAVDLQPSGSSYHGSVEEIVSGTPLPVTDLLAHPQDGVIYFTIGGRGATSGVYRLSWIGQESEQQHVHFSETQSREAERARAVLRRLISFYGASDYQAAIQAAWPHLADGDRTIRHAARIILEHIPHELWQERVFSESRSRARITGLLALARSDDSRLLPRMIDELTSIDWNLLTDDERHALLRCYYVSLTRLSSKPAEERVRQSAAKYLETIAAADDHLLEVARCRLLVFLDAPLVPELVLQRVGEAVTSEQRLAYLVALRHQHSGWTNPLRSKYFQLLREALAWRGGLSLSKYIQLTTEEALSHVPEGERARLAEMVREPLLPGGTQPNTRPFVREWSLKDLSRVGTERLDDANPRAGRKLFAEARCFACHRVRGEGGAVGPDLTTVAQRMTTQDLLEAIVEPSRVISDQFAATTAVLIDGRVLRGRVVNLQRDALLLQTDMLDPANLERIKIGEVESMRPAETSMMPDGLLNTLSYDEIRNLIAFLKYGY